MGHCYEFALDVTPGCGHAMTVSGDGGSCVCPICGARCQGRFKACEAILRRPGYVPAFAPSWAIAGRRPHVPGLRQPAPNLPAIAWRALD